MPLTGRAKGNEVDFPKTVRESVTTMPYSAGGTILLGTTDERENIVLVSDLRRFENSAIARGVQTGGDAQALLTDALGSFIDSGVEVGDLVTNSTDGSSATITALTATTITATLAGGSNDDWDDDDVYAITAVGSHANGRASEIREVTLITDLDVWIKFDGDASVTDHTVHLEAGEAYNKSNIRIVGRINFVNTTGTETPTVRWTVWGV